MSVFNALTFIQKKKKKTKNYKNFNINAYVGELPLTVSRGPHGVYCSLLFIKLFGETKWMVLILR